MSDQHVKKIPFSAFTTEGLAPHRKYDDFRDSMGVVFDVTAPTVSGSDFYGHIASYHLGELMIVRCNARGQKFVRTPQMIAGDGIDHVLMQLFLSGHTRTNKGSVGGEGKLIVIDTSQPWEAVNGDFDNITVVTPRRFLSGKLVAENDHHGRTISTESALGKVLSDFLISIYNNAATLSVADAPLLSKQCTDLITAVLNQEAGAKTSALLLDATCSNTILLRAKQYIDANFTNQSLDMESVRVALGVSRSHLYRAFNSIGGVATYIRDRRLAAACKLLSGQSTPRLSVKEAAFAVGFSSESAFSRTFKQCYGIAPKDARAATTDLREQKAESLIAGRQWESWFRRL